MKNHFNFFVYALLDTQNTLKISPDAPHTPDALEWNHNYARSAPARAIRCIFNHFKGEPP